MFIHSHKIKTFEHASQLTQDIKISLKFSLKHKVIPKAGEQPSTTTHASRDSKGKSVIGGSSRNAKGVNVLSVKAMVAFLHNVSLEIF